MCSSTRLILRGLVKTGSSLLLRLDFMVENAWNLLVQRGTVLIHRKTQTDALRTALKHYHML